MVEIDAEKMIKWLEKQIGQCKALEKEEAEEGRYLAAHDYANDAATFHFLIDCIKNPEKQGGIDWVKNE